jgi:hypothetical protein
MTIRKFFWVLYGAFFILLIALGLTSTLLNRNQEDVNRSQEVRYQSYLLAYEFRQSVDDLTRVWLESEGGFFHVQKTMKGSIGILWWQTKKNRGPICKKPFPYSRS